ncbi:MAG: SDR family oxidoreductase [Chloroflexaceae bacterium]|jgi:NAD(P)-dependent dehydrogenase (short-subunit alcohol dehydrogenase family)|nr:SDR family oxidoreductase [Chloroflexaceae bacterium]
MPLTINLTNRTAFVTGVSSGIGAGIALALAQAGAAVAGCGLEPEDSPGAMRFLAQAAQQGCRAVYRQADVADAQSARAVVNWAAQALGGLDVVVSNAGRNVFEGASACSDEQWQANIELNMAAHWRVAQAARPHLAQASQPVIIIIASNHAYRTLPGCFPYNVAKAGLTALVQSLALEWGPHIRAVGVAPGFINTPLADAWFNEFPDPAAKRAQVEGLHPVGRLGTPADVGALCAFLASPLAGFISGSTLLIDGGRSAVMQD